MGACTGYFYLLIIVVLGILIKILTPKVKGWFGETIVATMLSGLPENEYKVLNNIMLNTEYGTTQIDHVIVSIGCSNYPKCKYKLNNLGWIL